MPIRIILCAAVAAALWAAPADAATNNEWAQCNDVNNEANADRNIEVCTRIINDRRSNARDRSQALTARCGLWFTKRQVDRGLEDCNQAIATNPKNAVAYNNRANIWRDKGDYDRAIADYSEAIRLNSKGGVFFDNRGTTWYSKGDFQSAIADHTEAIRRFARDNIAYENRARAHLYSGSVSQAVSDMNQAIKLSPKDAYHVIWLEIVNRRNNLPSRLTGASVETGAWPGPVIRLFRGQLTPEGLLAAASDPDPLKQRGFVCEANFFSGWWALQRGDRQEAARLFQVAANDCPFRLYTWRSAREELRSIGNVAQPVKPRAPDAIAHFNRANDWRNKGDLDRAIDEFTEAIRLNPNYADAYDNRGSAYQAKGDLNRAIADFTETIRLNPNYPDAYINRGTCFDDRGELDRAIDDFSQAIRLDPKRAPTHYLRGYVLNKKGEIDRAIADFTEAIRLDPNYARAYYTRGIAQQAKGEYQRAIADLNDAIRLDPKDAAAFYYRGRAHLYNSLPAQAIADLNQASELDPKDLYHALWVDIVGHRSKAPSRLAKAITFMDLTRWPAPVIRMFLGQSAPSAVLAAASDPDPRKRAEQICETHFYSGHWSLRQGNRQEATRLFRLAANDCPRNAVEWGAARADLRALGQTP